MDIGVVTIEAKEGMMGNKNGKWCSHNKSEGKIDEKQKW